MTAGDAKIRSRVAISSPTVYTVTIESGEIVETNRYV